MARFRKSALSGTCRHRGPAGRRLALLGLRIALAGGVATFVLGAFASSASAHTQLLEASPQNRSSLEESPELLTLTFAEAVDPLSVQLTIISLSGEIVPGAQMLTPPGRDQEIISYTLPELANGVYGLAWVTVGPDGHRVSGEVVVGIGVADASTLGDAKFSRTPALDQFLGVLNGVVRYAWYIGLALTGGALFVLYTALRQKRSGAAHDLELPNARQQLTAYAKKALIVGLVITHVGILLRTLATVTLVTRGYNSGSTLGDLSRALIEGQGLILLAATLGAGALVIWSPRLARTRNPITIIQVGLALMAVIAAGSLGSHTAVLSEGAWEWTGIWVAALHLSASSIWAGPLLIVAGISLNRNWRALPWPQRSQALRELTGRFAPLAAVSFAVLLLTGLRSTWLLAGNQIFSSGYGIALLSKLILVALVLLPIALYNDWNLGLLSRRRRGEGAGLKSPRTLKLEAAALSAVIVVATVIVSMNPAVFSSSTGGGNDPAEESSQVLAMQVALSDGPPESADDCAGRTVGRANCYRDYFAKVMREQDASAAVAEIDLLKETHEHIRADCHQVVHDLGNDAAEYYGDVGVALTFEGSPCWSGYYHGVVEYAISQFTGSTLYEELPNICTTAAANRYSFTHYNCVHGLGHGVMLNLDGDLFASLNFCEALTDRWELSSCVGGSFMENVTAAQQGLLDTDVSREDLEYPCNAVKEGYVDECWAMQTSWILSQIGYEDSSFARAFKICDGIREDMISVCYQSMGRDVSGFSLLNVDQVLRLCSLGHPSHQEFCWVGAALNAVYNEHNTVKATELCERVLERYAAACFAARNHAASTFT